MKNIFSSALLWLSLRKIITYILLNPSIDFLSSIEKMDTVGQNTM